MAWKDFWSKLTGWQKGAIIVIVFHIIFSYIVLYETRYGNNFGDEIVPATVLFYLTDLPAAIITGSLDVNNCFVISDCSFGNMMAVFLLFIIISSIYYGVIGALIGKLFEFIFTRIKK